MERVWREADLPADMDGYVRTVLHNGKQVTLVVTNASLTPRQRAKARRRILAQDRHNEDPPD
ncbi:hypothetical protein [Frankia gtarii]|uniref:hypothetical protein n=1 Tax=Frankia gtarii TaxID=2950102 RepID=UPI0021C100C1|nr:hypothetical protein [Frankia gtarii]